MHFPHLQRVIDRKRYDTANYTILAHDVYWDGHNMERDGRNAWLCRTRNGAYVLVTGSYWQGERDELRPLTQDEAYGYYESLPEHEVEVEDAFPNVVIEEA